MSSFSSIREHFARASVHPLDGKPGQFFPVLYMKRISRSKVSKGNEGFVFRAGAKAGTDYFFVAFQFMVPRGFSAVPDMVVPSTVPL